MNSPRSNRANRIVMIAGPIVALVIGAATAQLRDQVGATDVGVALAIVVALAALAGRGPGLTTAITAALTFNFFHTKPYHSLRIHEPKDVAIVALLAVLGLVISDISAWRRRRDAVVHRGERARNAPKLVAELTSQMHPVGEVWTTVVGAVLDQLGLAQCGVVHEQPTDMPLISRPTGKSDIGNESFVLPAHGAACPIIANGTPIAYLVVAPAPGTTSLTINRRVVAALADHIGLALSYSGAPAPAPAQPTAAQQATVPAV